ncbi:MAG: response regulator [Treponema sp.]|nr:response regulator [Treponema sp.]
MTEFSYISEESTTVNGANNPISVWDSDFTGTLFNWLLAAVTMSFVAFALGLLILYKNYSVKKQLEKFKLEETSTLNAILDSTPDMIFCKDLNSRYTRSNKSMEMHFNLRKQDIIGKSDSEALGIPSDLAEQYLAMDQKIFNEGKTITYEEFVPSPGGELQLVETIKAPLIQNGKVTGLVGLSRNITNRKAIEEEAKSASQAKSRFLANMSHEIRTPMNSIIGFTELALDDEIPPETRNYLEKINTNSEWLLHIINDILDISKIESGKMDLENIPFDIHELFSSCRTLVVPKAVEKGLILHFYAEPSIGRRPVGDPAKLRQIIVNLLSNAIKFTDNGMVKLSSEIIEKDENTVTIYFEVKDNGIGMMPEHLEKIFEPFTQAETGTTRKYGGTGLGLAIAKNLVELMGGKLSVESALGVGSKFSFTLKFNTIDISAGKAFAKGIILNQIEKPAFDAEILLCEDNEMNQEVICEHLERVGIKTVIAGNGKIGVDIVSERKSNNKKQFDLIFMDTHMPVMDGLEAATKIIELDTGIPIVAMTANVMLDDREIYKAHGMYDCVSKPFTSQELWQCLLKYLKPVERKTSVYNVHKHGNSQQNNAGNIMDDPEFKKQIQVLFVKINKNKHEEIEKALDEKDVKLAHTLKSNTDQLDMISLQKAAAVVEQNLKGGLNMVPNEQMNTLKAELEAAIKELSKLAEKDDLPESA